jgi:hypothetical protein
MFKEKKFSSHRRVNVSFQRTKKAKIKATTHYFIKRFFKQVLDFHRPSQNFMPDNWAFKSLVPTAWPMVHGLCPVMVGKCLQLCCTHPSPPAHTWTCWWGCRFLIPLICGLDSSYMKNRQNKQLHHIKCF